MKTLDDKLWEKQLALTKWLNKDISTWSAKRIHAVYETEKRKRTRVYMKDLFK